jgi:hypothetical protein
VNEWPIWTAAQAIVRIALVVAAIELVVETFREAAAVNAAVDLLVAATSVAALQRPVALEVLPVWAAEVVEEAAAASAEAVEVVADEVAGVVDVNQRTISRTRK